MESLYKPARGDVLPLQVCVPPAPGFLLGFRECLEKMPQSGPFSVSFLEASGLETISHVSEGAYPIGILRYPQSCREYFENALEDANLAWEPLWEFDMCLIFSTEHPLASQSEVPCRLLNGYTEIICGDFDTPSEDRDCRRKIYTIAGNPSLICCIMYLVLTYGAPPFLGFPCPVMELSGSHVRIKKFFAGIS